MISHHAHSKAKPQKVKRGVETIECVEDVAQTT